MYRSLAAKDPASRYRAQHHLSPEAARLVGFMCGNVFHPGCLTLDENCRLHSCEKGNYCKKVLQSPVVRIQPVVSRLPGGEEILELGVGGGDDLNREVELDVPETEMDALLTMFVSTQPWLVLSNIWLADFVTMTVFQRIQKSKFVLS